MGNNISNDKIVVEYGIDPQDIKQKNSKLYLKQERNNVRLHSDVITAFFNGNDFSHDENSLYRRVNKSDMKY